MNHLPWPAGSTSEIVDAGSPTHVLDFGGPERGSSLMCLHGFGGSALNWGLLGPRLTDEFAVTAPDLLGHGLTSWAPPIVDVATVLAQVDALLRRGAPSYLVGNSFGGAIALMQAQQAPETVAGIVILDAPFPGRPTWPLDPILVLKRWLISAPGMSALMLRRTRSLTPQQVVEGQLRSAGMDPDLLDGEAFAASVALERVRHGRADAHATQQQILRSLLRHFERGRTFAALTSAVTAPVLWLHGEADPLVKHTAARDYASRHPGWEFESRSDVGHVPQLEAPEWIEHRVRSWVRSQETIHQGSRFAGDES